ncbi:SH3 domain-containing protein [uncultured Clostridium sp.]|uniref:SH3 domain-containing protein n=1 Tax=uncultured Clostridium sp. TaxID=59620 RepID=UPI002607B862|nr:SH3 domain-containing protein [uncultured Clostridium sp.]
MKNKKVSMLIAASAAAATMLVATPSTSSFATTIKHEKNTKSENTNTENQNSTLKNGQVNNINKLVKNEQVKNVNQSASKKTAVTKSTKSLKKVELAQVNLFTGKVVKLPKETERAQATGFSVNFNGSNHITYYNNQNVNPDMVQTEFHSKTQEQLYNYLMNPNNRWVAENEAIGLHGGDTANDCVFFVSSALRAIGINIPDNIGYTTNLMNELQNLGWERETNLSTLEPGDICFASTAHTYVFMGWANKAEGVAWVADNQFSWFGTNFHPRSQASVPNVDVSPTTCYYRLPGNYSVVGNTSQVNMPVNYDYSVGTVNAQGLNVRQEPALDSSVLTCLNYGQRVQILSQDGNWLKINYNGQPAYVWASYVTGTTPTVKKPYEGNYNVISTGTVNFDGGAYTDVMSGGTWYSNVRGTLNNGTKVSIINQNANWYQIEYKDGTAWIPKDRLQTNLSYKVIGTGKVDFNSLSYTDVMSEGTWYSNIVGTLNNGTSINIIGQNADWYKIEYNNGVAWIPKNRVESGLNDKVIGTGKIDFNDLSYTDVMSEGTWYSTIVGALNNGSNVKIISQNADWYQIEYNNGTAWVLKSRVNTSLNDNYKVISTGQVNFLSGNYTDIMSEGTWYSTVLGTINNGTNIKIIGENTDWYKIEYNNGTAWIPKNRVNTNVNRKIIEKAQINFLSGNYTDIMSAGTWYSDVAGTLNNGTNINIVGENGNWFEIEYNNGLAWVPKARVNTNVNRKVIQTGYVNFLSGGYTDIMSEGTWYSNVAGTLNNGTKINVVGENTNWFEIEYGNGLVWIPKNRVHINRKIIEKGQVNFLSGNYTDIMSEGTWYSNVAGTLNNGTNVNIVAENGSWLEIEYQNGLVWIPKARVNTNIDRTVIQTGYVNFLGGSYTDIMSAGTWYSDVAGTLNNETKVNIVSQKNNWYEIEYGNGTVWIPTNRVNTLHDTVLGTGTVDFSGGSYTDVMSAGTWYSTVVGTLNNGTNINIVGESGNWYKIETGNTNVWIPKDRVNTDYGKPSIKTAYINFNGGNFTDIMNGPTWDTSLAGTLNNGTQVSVIGENGAWYQIKYGNGSAWVLKDRVGTSQYNYGNAVYSETMNQYIADELQEYIDCVGGGLSNSQLDSITNQLAGAINPQNAATDLEFLRIDQFRNVNFNAVQNLLNGKGVFSGQAAAFIGAAKQYNLDPVYLMSQSALETGWGTSNFAQGITITQIANENEPIYENGVLVGYQMINLPAPVTVYDLFGIGAYNASAYFPNKTTILATTYAYNHGWTNVSNAIYGAAAFLSNNYVHNPDIAQNTPYEIRYIDAPADDIWHQYATDITYAEQIAGLMSQNKDLYSEGDVFNFAVPQFQGQQGVASFAVEPNAEIKSEPKEGKENVVKNLKKGSKVVVTGEKGNWYKVNYGEGTGWVKKDKIKKEK